MQFVDVCLPLSPCEFSHETSDFIEFPERLMTVHTFQVRCNKRAPVWNTPLRSCEEWFTWASWKHRNHGAQWWIYKPRLTTGGYIYKQTIVFHYFTRPMWYWQLTRWKLHMLSGKISTSECGTCPLLRLEPRINTRWIWVHTTNWTNWVPYSVRREDTWYLDELIHEFDSSIARNGPGY